MAAIPDTEAQQHHAQDTSKDQLLFPRQAIESPVFLLLLGDILAVLNLERRPTDGALRPSRGRTNGAGCVVRPAELPIGIVTSAVGVPVFIFLLRRRQYVF